MAEKDEKLVKFYDLKEEAVKEKGLSEEEAKRWSKTAKEVILDIKNGTDDSGLAEVLD